MENWEIALNRFVNKWQNKKEVIGIIVCGSFITGNPSKHSDLDIHIILDENISWRERGNEVIDGILIEYFVNNSEKHLEYFENDFKNNRKHNAHMFMTGKIILDKKGEVKKLVKLAHKYFKKNFKKLNKTEIEISKYHIWDKFDNLEEIYDSNSEEFIFSYFNSLKFLLDNYLKFLGFVELDIHRVFKFLYSKQSKEKYNIPDFSDKEFLELFLVGMNSQNKDEMIKIYKKITSHVLDKMGGFEIDG